ncbi:MAG: hypothetical protein RLY97_1522 [Pseudomonadota bacterium]|jgi:selenocysteine lyase/cysteine desulfurase
MSSLPEGFAPLEPFAAEWAIEGTAARAARRDGMTTAEGEAFYAAGKDLLAPALDYLDAKGFAAFADQDRRLMAMMLSLAHVALAVELQGPDEAKHTKVRKFMVITKSPADAGLGHKNVG